MITVWLQIPAGFYSAVTDDLDPTALQVRGRARVDLEYLVTWLNEEHNVDVAILSWPERDYPYRVIIDRELWGSFVLEAAETISYGNFKDAVKKVNPKRYSTYTEAWSVFTKISREDGSPAPYQRGRKQVVPYKSPYSPGYVPMTLSDLLDREEYDQVSRRSLHDLTEDEWRTIEDEMPTFPVETRQAKRGKRKGKKNRR